jgi:hypothetical protein
MTFHWLVISVLLLPLLFTEIDASEYQSVRQKRANDCPIPPSSIFYIKHFYQNRLSLLSSRQCMFLCGLWKWWNMQRWFNYYWLFQMCVYSWICRPSLWNTHCYLTYATLLLLLIIELVVYFLHLFQLLDALQDVKMVVCVVSICVYVLQDTPEHFVKWEVTINNQFCLIMSIESMNISIFSFQIIVYPIIHVKMVVNVLRLVLVMYVIVQEQVMMVQIVLVSYPTVSVFISQKKALYILWCVKLSYNYNRSLCIKSMWEWRTMQMGWYNNELFMF